MTTTTDQPTATARSAAVGVVAVSGDQGQVAVQPSDGEQVNGLLAHDGRDLEEGDTVRGTVFTTDTGGAVVYVAAD